MSKATEGTLFSRYLQDEIRSLAWERNKMAFLSGPRQVGKTTLGKSYRSTFDEMLYCNWDEIGFRRLWTKNPQLLLENFPGPKQGHSSLLILDEIHKAKGWKQKLKGIYDTSGNEFSILVTGSARLNVFKKGAIP